MRFRIGELNFLVIFLKILGFNGISGAPVLDPLSQRYVGFVDMLDICGFMVASFAEEETFKLMGVVDRKVNQ